MWSPMTGFHEVDGFDWNSSSLFCLKQSKQRDDHRHEPHATWQMHGIAVRTEQMNGGNLAPKAAIREIIPSSYLALFIHRAQSVLQKEGSIIIPIFQRWKTEAQKWTDSLKVTQQPSERTQVSWVLVQGSIHEATLSPLPHWMALQRVTKSFPDFVICMRAFIAWIFVGIVAWQYTHHHAMSGLEMNQIPDMTSAPRALGMLGSSSQGCGRISTTRLRRKLGEQWNEVSF